MTNVLESLSGTPRGALRNRRRQHRPLRPREPFRLALNTNPVPQLQIQQPPNPVIVIAILRPMLGKNPLNGLALEISALHAPRAGQQLFNRIQPRPRQPSAPRSRKPQLAPV